MPSGCVLHVGYALTLDSLGDDCGRLSLGIPRLLKGRTNLIKIVSIDNDGVEIERLKLLIDLIWRAYLVNLSVDLQIVVIHDYNKVVQFSVACPHGCLPDLTLLNLAVSG